MPLYASKRTFINHPEGLFQAVCVDVVDLGMVENKKFGNTSHQCRIVFQTNEPMENGKPFLISQKYTLSTDPKANLTKHLQTWRGRPFTPDEAKKFDVESIIGVNAQIQVQHNASATGDVFANITAILPVPKGTAKMTATDYIRMQDRPDYVPPKGPSDELLNPKFDEDETGEDSLPF